MFEIILNNILAFPANIWSDILAFFNSFYNPNNSILENIFYNEIIWVGLALWIYIKNGGAGIIYILLAFPLICLICHMIIISFGIEIFFILLITINICYYWRKGLNNIFDIIFKITKYIVLVVLVSYIILTVFGTVIFFIAIIVALIRFTISIIKKYRKKVEE